MVQAESRAPGKTPQKVFFFHRMFFPGNPCTFLSIVQFSQAHFLLITVGDEEEEEVAALEEEDSENLILKSRSRVSWLNKRRVGQDSWVHCEKRIDLEMQGMS